MSQYTHPKKLFYCLAEIEFRCRKRQLIFLLRQEKSDGSDLVTRKSWPKVGEMPACLSFYMPYFDPHNFDK